MSILHLYVNCFNLIILEFSVSEYLQKGIMELLHKGNTNNEVSRKLTHTTML